MRHHMAGAGSGQMGYAQFQPEKSRPLIATGILVSEMFDQ
jgi:hypothetical protein